MEAKIRRKIMRCKFRYGFLVAWSAVFVSLAPIRNAAARGRQTDAEDWPPIKPEELAVKDNPASPGSSAMILYRDVHTDDVARVRTEYFRIKIFTDAGQKYADVEIPWVPKVTEVSDIRGRTVSPDGTAADFNGEVFDKTVVKSRRFRVEVKAFTLPAVQKGSVIEYSYRVRWREEWPDYLVHPGLYVFQEGWAVPTEVWDVDQDIFVRKEHFSIRPLPQATLGWTVLRMPVGANPRREADGTTQLDVENIPAVQEEEFMPPEGTVKCRVALYYVVGAFSSADAYWGELAKHRAEALEKYLGKPKAMENEVSSLISPGDSVETKLRKLYNRVQQVRFLSYENAKTAQEEKREDVKQNKKVSDVLKHEYAAANEVNLLFVALARAVGFEADPVFVTQRATRYFTKELPFEGQLDAMVVWLRTGQSDYYFDPATLDCPFGLLPWEESAARGIKVDVERPALITTTLPKSSDAVVERKASLILDAEGKLEGKMTVSYTGQEALERRISNRNKDDTGRRKALEDEVRGWLPAGSSADLKSVAHWDESDEALSAEFTVKIPSATTATGHRMLVPLEICEINGKQFFKSATRVHDVYFDYPYEESDEVTVQIPAGYAVEGLPKPQNVRSPFGSYEMSVVQEGGSVHLKRRVAVQQFYIPVNDYSRLRSFFSSVRVGDEEQMVLQTKATEQAQAR